MIAKFKQHLERRRLDRAQAIIESYGLAVVKLKTLGKTTYIINADGTHMKLTKVGK